MNTCNDDCPPQNSRVWGDGPWPAETLGSPQGTASYVGSHNHWARLGYLEVEVFFDYMSFICVIYIICIK